MIRCGSSARIPILITVATLLGVAVAHGQVPRITSNGSLGPVSLLDGYYTTIFNTDAMTVDVYTSAGGYTVGGFCPPGTYTGPGDPDGCARLVSQPGGQDIVVWDYTTVILGHPNIFVRGSRPAAIAATGTITISGGITAENGYAGAPSPLTCPQQTGGCGAGQTGSGPGGGGGGAGPGYYVTVNVGGFTGYDPLAGGGGAGGGAAGAGAVGGASRIIIDINGIPNQLAGGSPGPAYLLAAGPLRAGSGGGSGGDRAMWGGPATYGGAAGGAGGGALILATPGDIAITGTVSAAGKPGGGSNDGGGGGGGGGGFLVFQVDGILINDVTGTISAAGGTGGIGPGGQMNDSYGGAGGGGIISIQGGTYSGAGTLNVTGGNPGVVAYQLEMSGGGTGSGTVTSQVGLVPAISCAVTLGVASGTCSQLYPAGTLVTLTPVPATGSAFTMWNGACTGTGACTVPVNAIRHVEAVFDLVPYPVTVTGSGTGSGTVTSQVGLEPAINCVVTQGVASGACSQMYVYGTSVTLTASGVGSAFTGWSGACAGTGACVVGVMGARTVTATFVVHPTVSSVTPSAGPTAGGTSITVGGTGFVVAGTTVLVGGAAASGVVVSGPTLLTAVTPSGGLGAAAVTVTTAGGTATLPGGFTYMAAPGAFSKTAPANAATGETLRPTLTWTASGQAASYEYCVATSPACAGGWTNVGGMTNAGVSGLATGTTYYWQVRAVNPGGTTDADGGTWWSFTTKGAPGDYEGDGKTDLVAFRPTTGQWWGVYSSHDFTWPPGYLYQAWGMAGDVPVPGDYDGDGQADLVVFRPTTGEWWGLLSSHNYDWQLGYLHVYWGLAGDVPVAGDYDGDGRSDLMQFRPSTGEWFGLLSSSNYTLQPSYLHVYWGLPGDVPVSGDYDGDGKSDLVVFRPTTGIWWGALSSKNYDWHGGYLLVGWGGPGDIPVSGDFDGDGRSDLMVFRPTTAQWWGALSSHDYDWHGGYRLVLWGSPGDKPVSGDFDGDGRTDVVLFRPATGEWWGLFSGHDYAWQPGYLHVWWGAPGDTPMQGLR